MRLCIVPEYPMSLMTGGLQVQAVETYETLASLDGEISVELFDWSRSKTPADLYHFIGLSPYALAELVYRAQRPYVITILFGGALGPLRMRMAAWRRILGSVLSRGRTRHKAIERASAIVTVTEGDRTAAQIIFGVEKTKIEVVSHGVADGYFECTPDAWCASHGQKDFVLCVGAVQQRKNQLLLAETCNRLKLPLVLLGPTLPGQGNYAQRVGEAMKENESFGGCWLQHLQNQDELLQSAYAACRIFALLSRDETQPISVLQAMAARKPVLLLKAPYAKDKLFRSLPQAPSCELGAVAGALKQVWDSQMATELSTDYKWSGIARRLQTIYKQVLSSRRMV